MTVTSKSIYDHNANAYILIIRNTTSTVHVMLKLIHVVFNELVILYNQELGRHTHPFSMI